MPLKVINTNLSDPVTIQWNGRKQNTGIYKVPQSEGIFLTREGVRGDTIGNPKVHGGVEKAAYLFASDHYPYWQDRYPQLEWRHGMFGENLTIGGMDESDLFMGSFYQIGAAKVQITTPREPCFKLGIRFGNQGIIEEFIAHGCPGTYISVIEPGHVQPGDLMTLLDTPEVQLSISAYFRLLFEEEKDPILIEKAVSLTCLSEGKKKQLLRWKA